jgi:hypothetical protein
MSSQNPGQPAPGYQQPQQPPKKKHGCLWTAIIAVVVIIVVVIAAVSCMAKGANDAVNAVDSATSAQHKVTYKVTTNGKANITYGASSGTSTEDISKDWTKDQTITGWDGVSLTVTGDMDGATKVSCEVLVDGKSQSKNSGSGNMASASCDATSIK